MNPKGLRFFLDPEFREKYTSDVNFWIILIGMSITLLIIFKRDWVIEPKNYKKLLFLAIGLAIIGNTLAFGIYRHGTALGALNGPLISILLYKLLFNWFVKKYSKKPASPFNTYGVTSMKYFKDGLLNFVFLIISFFSIALLGLWSK